tara:strand:+ start:196 stop:402 length:207 start_codon:yes stop_codon:yes gene_type:complete
MNNKIGAININIIDRKSLTTKKTYSFILPSKCISIDDTCVEVSLLMKKYQIKGKINEYVTRIVKKQAI